MAEDNNLKKAEPEKKKSSGWKQKTISALTIILVIAITVSLFIFRDRIADLEEYGYLGAFLISLIANATIVLPMPGLLILIGLGATFNPLVVAICGAFGGALGEMSGYIVGRGGRGITSENKWYRKTEHWMHTKKGFLTVFLFALVPLLPLDVAGIIAGVSHYPIWKFIIACFLGKLILYIIMIYAGAWGWDTLLEWIS